MTTENDQKEEKTPIPCSMCGKTGNIIRYNENTKFAVCADCIARLTNQEKSDDSAPRPVHPPRVIDKTPGRRNPLIK